MAPPNGVSPAGSREAPLPTPAQERQDILSTGKLVPDERWQDPSFRTQHHLELYLALKALEKFMAGDIPVEKMQSAVESWMGSDAYQNPENQEFNQAVVDNLHAKLRLFQTEENSARAKQLAGVLPAATPPPPKEPVPEEGLKTEPAPQQGVVKQEEEKKGPEPRYLSYGVEINNDTFVSDVLLNKVFQINPDAFLPEKTDFVLKVPVTFKGGPLKLLVRPYGGMHSSRAIPGTEVGETGRGWKVGADFGLSNPWGKNFEASGFGFEVAGISSHAGEANDIEAPGPVTRVHLFRQKDISFNLGKKFQLGLNSFWSNQDTHFILGGNEQLLEENGSNFSTAGNLFARNKLNLLGLSLRIFPNGSPQKDPVENKKGEFRPGEAWPKIGHVAVGSQINRNRRRGVPPFANNRVFLGTFEVLGAQSRAQYDALGFGLALFSVQDGAMMAGNIDNRSEVLRRGNWTERGVMIALDGANLLADIIISAKADDDPPQGQTIEEFTANPGSVTDFEGRAGKLNLYSNLFELGVSGADALGAFGREYDENKLHYGLAHGAMFALGIPLYFFSAPISGAQCAPDGTFLLKCGFGTTANTKGHYFSEDTFDSGPGDMAQVERQFLVSSMGSALMIKGGGGLVEVFTSLGKDAKDKKSSSQRQVGSKQSAAIPRFNLNLGPQGGMATLSWQM